MKLRLLLLIPILFIGLISSAQESKVKGVATDENTKAPLSGAVITVKGTKLTTITNEKGEFTIDKVPYGEQTITIESDKHTTIEKPVKVDQPEVDLGTVTSSISAETVNNINQQDAIPVVTLTESNLDESADADASVSSVLTSSKDLFLSKATYTFRQARFKIRGYNLENFPQYMNGTMIENPDDGTFFRGGLEGQNDLFYNKETVFGLGSSTFAFGGIGGSTNVDNSASSERKGFKIGYAATNYSYRNKLQASYATGITKHGWAVAISVSDRWAQKGYEPGTAMQGFSYFASVEKIFKKQSLALTTFGSPTTAARYTGATQETFNLAGSNYYNPNWGYQTDANGNKQIRNAAISKNFQPTAILTHDWKINDRNKLVTAVSYAYGMHNNGGLGYYNATIPEPDYYKYLPSYQDDSIQAKILTNLWKTNVNTRQIAWDSMYAANQLANDSVTNANGIKGNTVYGKRAHYFTADRVTQNQNASFNTTFNSSVNDHVALTAGLTYQYQKEEFFLQMKDLLGADYYVDLNQFASQDFPTDTTKAQNDLNHSNRIVKVGDRFGYDYVMNFHKGSGWLQSVFKFKRVDFFIAGELSDSYFWRTGKYKNGLFPDSSLGDSKKLNFLNYAVKGGLTVKMNGRNYLYANGEYMTRAPHFNNSFQSPRTRNSTVYGLTSENIYSAELGYLLSAPKFKLKVAGFFTQFQNETQNRIIFYGDRNTFVNYGITGIDKRNLGGELAIDAAIYKGFSVTGVLTMGQYIYTNRPTAIVTQDNSNVVIDPHQTIYWKNYHVGGTPQLASTIGLNYRSKKYWHVGVDLNYFDWMYADLSPFKRTLTATDLVVVGSDQWNQILAQEKRSGQFTMDIRAGYSWRLNSSFSKMSKKHTYYINFNGTISNVTNNTKFAISSYEQSRFDYKDAEPNKFPNKYTYMHGIGFYVGATFRMQ